MNRKFNEATRVTRKRWVWFYLSFKSETLRRKNEGVWFQYSWNHIFIIVTLGVTSFTRDWVFSCSSLKKLIYKLGTRQLVHFCLRIVIVIVRHYWPRPKKNWPRSGENCRVRAGLKKLGPHNRPMPSLDLNRNSILYYIRFDQNTFFITSVEKS